MDRYIPQTQYGEWAIVDTVEGETVALACPTGLGLTAKSGRNAKMIALALNMTSEARIRKEERVAVAKFLRECADNIETWSPDYTKGITTDDIRQMADDIEDMEDMKGTE